ncbi:MAG: hypothetical protein GY725_04095 [bacterium]|nr:hypothetical protein [bacterium]
MIEARGAPTDQGQAQGRAQKGRIRALTGRLRGRHSWMGWLHAQRVARQTSARAVADQLPGLHERLEGIARGAGVSPGSLQVAEAWQRVQGVGYCDGATLQGVFDLPPELREALSLRISRPDAGGFPSIELTCAPWSGCIAGVNSEGLGAICSADRDSTQPSLRFLTQEFLFRARDLTAGIDHLRRRGSYSGGTGRILLADAQGNARVLCFERGELSETEPLISGRRVLEPSVEIDLNTRTLTSIVGQGSAPSAENPS